MTLSATDRAAPQLQLLDGAQALFPRMLEAIEGARESVHLQVYHLGDARVGAEFAAALESACARGVTVELHLDGWGSAASIPSVVPRLRAAGARLTVHNRLRNLLWGRFDRNHRKILVVDGATAFVGGLNLAATYLGADGGPAWADLAVAIRGPSCARLLQALRRERSRAELGPGATVWLSRFGGGWKLRRRYVRAIARARRRIWIAHAYFLPDRALVRLLAGAARSGVDVRLLLPARSDIPLAAPLGRHVYPRLLDAGVRIAEWDESVLHAKVAAVDGERVLVGSFNLDPLSIINGELLLEAEAPALAQEAERWIRARLQGRYVSAGPASAARRLVADPLGRALSEWSWRWARGLHRRA